MKIESIGLGQHLAPPVQRKRTELTQMASASTPVTKPLSDEQVTDMLVASGTAAAARVQHPPEKSIYDFSEDELKSMLASFLSDLRSRAYSGMSKTELINDVYAQYVDCFGADFERASASRINGSDSLAVQRGKIASSFELQVGEMIGVQHHYGIWAAIKEARYGDMTDEEVVSAIRSKYPGQTTLLDCLDMMREMYDMQVSGKDSRFSPYFVSNLVIPLFAEADGVSGTVSEKMYLHFDLFPKMLNIPTDFDTLMENLTNLDVNAAREIPSPLEMLNLLGTTKICDATQVDQIIANVFDEFFSSDQQERIEKNV